MQISKKESNMLYCLKAFAILSVVSAHMPFGGDTIAEFVRISFSQIGVIIFFISSGFFYSRKRNDEKCFWKKKTKYLFIPWVLWSSIVYLISAFISRSFNGFPLSYIKAILGIGNVYWYLSVLVILFILFKYIYFYTHNWPLYLCIVISIVSIYLSAFGVIKYVYLSHYYNVLNWIGFFALGILIRRKNWISKLAQIPFFSVAIVAWALLVLMVVKRGTMFDGYIDVYSLPIELCGFVSFLFLSKILSKSRLLVDLGKKSFLIYLMHLQIAGAINTRLPYNTLFYILRPFIAVTVCYLLTKIFEFLINKLQLNKYNYILGLNR